ncbi:MAG: NAD(P)H-hydrate epimerase [Elusimicrobia bacterium]|nr:NAD(P)H-hydrate epimerase [Elusimicrobiota bacterium]
MKKVTVSQMRAIDNRTINEYGLSALVLMEHAGKAVADETRKLLDKRRRKAAVFCGPGNNGGDGLVAARWLHHYGMEVEVFFLGNLAKSSLETRLNFDITENLRLPLHWIQDNWPSLKEQIGYFNLIIDGLLGIGAHGQVLGLYKNIIDDLNANGVKIISIDIPSGLNADTGQPLGSCLSAAVTVTLGFPKIGFSRPGAKKYTGKVVVADIGLIDK